MSSTPTSQITRQVTSSVSNEPAANLATSARFEYASYLVQGATQGGDGSTLRLEVEKSMVVHPQGNTSNSN